jgi:hypothetical protein
MKKCILLLSLFLLCGPALAQQYARAHDAPLVSPPALVFDASFPYVRFGTMLPAACSAKQGLYHLTQVDGPNAAGLYRCNGSTYTAIGTATTPGGSSGDIQYNNAGSFGGKSLATLKSDLSLNNVNNTSDASKPVSTAQQTALDLKQNLLTNSAGLRAALSDESGTGAALFAGGNIGAATATSINGNTFTAGTYTLTGATGKTFTFNNTLTLSGTDGSTLNVGAGGTLGSNAYTSTAYARVYNSANISIPDATFTTLTFNSEREDNDTLHSTASNTDRLTCTTAGIYSITPSVVFETNNAISNVVEVQLNGSTTIGASSTRTAAGLDGRVSFTAFYRCVAAEYFTVRVYHNAGASKNILAAGNYSPEVTFYKVAP